MHKHIFLEYSKFQQCRLNKINKNWNKSRLLLREEFPTQKKPPDVIHRAAKENNPATTYFHACGTIIGAGELIGRVRNGIASGLPAIVTGKILKLKRQKGDKHNAGDALRRFHATAHG
jgi:hypothetical protein